MESQECWELGKHLVSTHKDQDFSIVQPSTEINKYVIFKKDFLRVGLS